MLGVFRSFALVPFVALLAACGDSPPGDRALAQITESVLTANHAMFEGGAAGADVVDITLTAWKSEDERTGVPSSRSAEWTAKLRFKEPIACIVAEVDGTRVVKVVADQGEELAFAGSVSAMKLNDVWQVHANASNSGGDFSGPGTWKPIWDRVPGLTMGYQVVRQGNAGNPKFRTVNFEPLSKLAPCIVEGSPEHQKLEADAQERWRKMQAAAAEQAQQRQVAAAETQRKQQEEVAERKRKYDEEQARLRDEAAERQRVAQEERQRQLAEAAARAKVAADDKKQKADEARTTRLMGVLKPFQSATGAVITAEAGVMLGALILDATIDDQKFAVAGHAVDLRAMPFKEFTYEGQVDERGAFAYKSSLRSDPVAFGAAGDKLSSRAGFTIAALAEQDRAKIDALLALGRRLGSAAPVTLEVESLAADLAKTREQDMKLTGLHGTVFYREKATPAVVPLFAADLAANKAFAWRNNEVVAVRLDAPVRGRGLYIRGTAAPSTELIVTINGVHQATVAAIPKLGAVIVTLPADLEVLDVRLQATGAVSARTIGLMK